MNALPDYTISSRFGYLYVRFVSPPGQWIRNRMRAAGMYYSRSENAWLADDRFTPESITRIIGINGKSKSMEVSK